MGRTYIVDETVGQYLSNINLQGKSFVSGLLIGQCSSQKDYVILATRTPPREEQNENIKHPKTKLDNLDEEWATEHAHQVSRMLPGGLIVLGVFIITTLELANDFQNALRRNGLTRWAKQIENGVYFINGQVKDEDCDLLEGQLLNSNHRSTATAQVCSGSVNLKGDVKCRAYIHSNKPKVKDAVQAVKRDILNTVADRCEILFEDLLLNENSEKEFHILPHRVFVPIPGSTVMLCDYKFGDESTEEIREHFIEMLDQMIQMECLEVAEEINTAFMSSSMNNEAALDNTEAEQPEQPVKTTIILKIQQNIGMIAAFAVAVLAAGISFHYFSD
ncbi:Protein odr-4 like protein [Fukomys damarensis]|uniref:Protein odr-4 homolog n=1 Tax=Fukomys damarensis TaxID=885580 RepID=A0A091DBW7_FUKDA|nr:Protein odr-4 like protein [Fukomys damarensis]